MSNPSNPVLFGVTVDDAARAKINLPLSVKGAENTRAYQDYMAAKQVVAGQWERVNALRGDAYTAAARAYAVEKRKLDALKRAASPNWSAKN